MTLLGLSQGQRILPTDRGYHLLLLPESQVPECFWPSCSLGGLFVFCFSYSSHKTVAGSPCPRWRKARSSSSPKPVVSGREAPPTPHPDLEEDEVRKSTVRARRPPLCPPRWPPTSCGGRGSALPASAPPGLCSHGWCLLPCPCPGARGPVQSAPLSTGTHCIHAL